MSVDFTPPVEPKGDRRTHVVIVYGGWGSEQGGQPLQTGQRTGTGKLLAQIESLKASGSSTIKTMAIQGSLTSNAMSYYGVTEFLQRNFDPFGKVIVYGFSAGGMDALRLTYHIWAALGLYDLQRNTFLRGLSPSGTVGAVRVDLLVTVDPATGPTSGLTQRRVFPSVRRNLNIYQTHAASAPAFSHGGPTVATDPTSTDVTNIDWSDRYKGTPKDAHGSIDDDSIDLVMDAIRSELGLFIKGDFPLRGQEAVPA